MLQEVMRLVLEAYYEPQFRKCSHGFRPNRGCHTALNEIYRTWVGTKWFIEGDIKGCFDNISHQKTLEILGRRIKDDRLLKLITEMLGAGYMEKWNTHGTFSGTPQGGIISPLLANIFLNELDTYVEDVLIPTYTKGKQRKLNPEWRTLSSTKSYFKKRGDWEEYWKRDERQRMIPSQDMYDPDYRRLRYVRYVDDFLLGVAGAKEDAENIRREIGTYLKTHLGLELSEEKTLITHAGNEKARFLNYEITVMNNDTRRTAYADGRKRRSINGGIWLGIPKDVTERWKAKVLKERRIEYRVEFLQLSDYDIVQRYEAEMQGLINYYTMAHDVNQKLRKVRYFFMASLARTLAYKHKTNHRRIYAKHIRYNAEGNKVIVVEVPRDGKQPLIASFGSKPIRQNRTVAIKDDLKATYRFIEPNQLVTRLLADVCELCGSKENVQAHHIRKLKDLKKRYEGRREKPEWVRRMISIQRKTLVVCGKCHKDIHNGTFDGVKLR